MGHSPVGCRELPDLADTETRSSHPVPAKSTPFRRPASQSSVQPYLSNQPTSQDSQAFGWVFGVTIGPDGSPGKEIRARSACRRQKVPIAGAAALNSRVVERTERLVPEEPSPASPRTKIRESAPWRIRAARAGWVEVCYGCFCWATTTRFRVAFTAAYQGGGWVAALRRSVSRHRPEQLEA
jgi:hypothetical protein